MAARRIPSHKLMRVAGQAVRERLLKGRLDQVLVTQAKRRINDRGDSTHRYPELWANKIPGHYRAGGQPLRDTGVLYNGLTSTIRTTPTMVTLRLQHPRKYPLFHQHGFGPTKGPNYIPKTKQATRFRTVKAALAAGMKWGKDFILAKKGVTVPQRKIFNLPPENLAEFREELARLTGGVAHG